jgi:hypothetical protein
MAHDHDRPRPAPGYEVTLLDGEAVMLHPATLEIMHLNRSATLIWQLCDGQRTVADICELLSGVYADAAPQVRLDVQRTLETFEERGALAFEHGPAVERGHEQPA